MAYANMKIDMNITNKIKITIKHFFTKLHQLQNLQRDPPVSSQHRKIVQLQKLQQWNYLK